jgi:ABC-type glycerol-3-phosphate transport system substrate-binding protein
MAGLTFILALGPAAFAGDMDITVFRPAVNPKDMTDPFVQAIEAYKKATKGKVTLVRSDWNNWPAKIITRLAAGDPIDVIFAGAQNFPQFYTKGYAQPVDGYVDLKAKSIGKAAMDENMKFDGKYYLAGNYTSAQPWMTIYNKTLMDENGIAVKDQPLALYKAGKWNLDSFRALAKKLTLDADKDGKTDVYGVTTWNHFTWIYMNGSSLTTIDAKGQAKLNFDDPRLLEALSKLKEAVDEGWYNPNNDSTGLERRTAAMYLERSWIPEQAQRNTKDEIVAVPLPYGPGNKDKRNFFMFDGYGIGAGSKKQKQAGQFIDLCLKAWYEYDLAKEEKYSKQVREMLAEMRKKPTYPEGSESLLETIKNDFIGEIVWGGIQPASAIASYKPRAQALIDEANTPPEKIERLPFKAINVTFENGDISAFKPMDPSKKSVSLSIVEGDKAIKGKSLLVTMDQAADGEWIDAFLTDAEKLGIVGWRDYRVSFDLKPLAPPPNADSYFYFQAYSQKGTYGNITYKWKEPDGVLTAMGEFRDIFKNGRWGLKFGGHFGADVVIDNIAIEEIK